MIWFKELLILANNLHTIFEEYLLKLTVKKKVIIHVKTNINNDIFTYFIIED